MKFETEVEASKKWSMQTLKNKAAIDWQKCVRAEYGAKDCEEFCIVFDTLGQVHSPIGYLVCVTCGKVGPWTGQEMDAGHFLGGRSNSILFEPLNIHPQCKYCNRTGGNPQAYRQFMIGCYSSDIVEALEKMKRESISFTRDELVGMRREYRERTRAAVKVIGGAK